MAIHGEDSLQALILAIRVLPSEFVALARKHGGRFSWLEDDELGLLLV
jgi:hypothetical protein